MAPELGAVAEERFATAVAPPETRQRRRSVIRYARLIGMACLGGFVALLAGIGNASVDQADTELTRRIQARSARGLEPLMAAVSWPGFPPESRIIPPLVIAGWLAKGRRVDAAFQAAAWGTGLLSTVVKAAVRRPRPLAPAVRVIVAPLGGSSFPSGHVLTYVGFYGFLAYLLALRVDDPVLRIAGVTSLLGVIGLIGPSRVRLGHHWPTDVLASYLLGGAYVLVLVEGHARVTGPAR
ncbi:MAG TPA: phosphatase PAP2 family protein [Candidatus Limnocylindrales bacterium]|jgi:undecaprenyl-diphosphatase